MAKQQSLFKTIIVGVVSGLITTAIVGAVTYHFARKTLASMIADGVEILNVQSTSESLAEIGDACKQVSTLLTERRARPATTMIDGLRTAFDELAKGINSVRTTEFYTVDDINKLTQGISPSSSRKQIIDRHVGKPKRTLTGLRKLEPDIAQIREMLEALDRQVVQEPYIDIDSFRSAVTSIERLASAAQASLESRQAATLQTLEKFDRRRRKATPEATPQEIPQEPE